MKTISLSVSESDYEAFRRAAAGQGRPIAQLIREAMAVYRAEFLPDRGPLTELPVLVGHRLVGSLPGRSEIYDEAFGPDPAEPDEFDTPPSPRRGPS